MNKNPQKYPIAVLQEELNKIFSSLPVGMPESAKTAMAGMFLSGVMVGTKLSEEQGMFLLMMLAIKGANGLIQEILQVPPASEQQSISE